MKVKTKPFGEIEISEKQKISFKNGILGFEEIKHFFLLDGENDSPFYWLQALEMPEIAFVIIDPAYVVDNYKLDINQKDLDELEIIKQDEMLIFSIVTIYEKPEDITVNLLGPVIINKTKRIGKQIINQNDEYEIKCPLLPQRRNEC
jgi:flagellar assembly factor FliW